MTRYLMAALLLVIFIGPNAQSQSPTEFTYQGELRTGEQPANGVFDIRVLLFAQATGGSPIATRCLNDVAVEGGKLVIGLDFGSPLATFGQHLEIQIREGALGACADLTGFETLTPRQKITPAPQSGLAADALRLGGQSASFYTNASNLNSGIINDARLPANLARLDAASNTFEGGVAVEGNLSILADGEISIPGPAGSFKFLRMNFLNGNANVSATGNSSALTLSGGSFIGAFYLDSIGRIAMARTLSIGSGEATNDALRVRGNGSIVKVALESGGTDQVAELAFYENLSNTNGVILREDGRNTSNALLVIDLTNGAETVMATFARDTNSFSAPIKAFRIDHPLDPYNKELWHSCVESPEMLNVYSGTVTTDEGGYAQVLLPAYFGELNIDPRYHLTVVGDEPLGGPADEDVWVLVKVARPIGRDGPDRFTIRTSEPYTVVSWQVSGVRNDAVARRFRIVPEQDKPLDRRGVLLVPEAFERSLARD